MGYFLYLTFFGQAGVIYGLKTPAFRSLFKKAIGCRGPIPNQVDPRPGTAILASSSEEMIRIIEANTDERITRAKSLFLEYAESLDFSLCFQNFDNELENFPGQYSPPTGNLFLAMSENEPIGCVGIRYSEKDICEMKRLYVKPKYRGKKAGKELAVSAIKSGKALGYEYMRLDTLSSMETANQLYKSLGFIEIDPYRNNPIDGAIYMELNLVTL